MAIYKVRDPSGRIREIKGPDGASDEEILAQAQTLFGNEQPAAKLEPKSDDELRRDAVQQAFDESTGLQKFGIGVAKPVVEGYHGVRKMLGGKADESAEARLKAIHGPEALAGELAGNVAALAIPGGAITRGLSAAPKAALGADLALNTLASGLQSEGRGEGFARGAAWGAGGTTLGAGLTRGAQALRPELREGAKALIDRGVPLTPGQALNGRIQQVENVLAKTPIVGSAVRKLQDTSVKGWNRSLLQDVALEPGRVTSGGSEGVRQVGQQFKAAYDNLFAGDLPTGQTKDAIGDLLNNTDLEPGTVRYLRDVAEDFGAGTISGTKLSSLDDELRKQAVAAARAGKPLDSQALNAARSAVRSSQSPKFVAEWGRLDTEFRPFATARKAATYAGPVAEQGVFTPKELLRAVAAQDKSSGKRALAEGVATLQQKALDAENLLQVPTRGLAEGMTTPIGFGAAILNPGAAAGAYAVGKGAVNEPMRKLIVNKIARQQPLTPQELEDAVRLGLTLGRGAGATAE